MPLLLDTCAALWISEDAPLSEAAVDAIDRAGDDGETIYLSPIMAWEIGMLVSRGRIALPTTPLAWVDQFLRTPNLRLIELSVSVLIASSFLPGTPPRDPADRIIIATARERNLRIVTRDRHILAYGKVGHVLTIPC